MSLRVQVLLATLLLAPPAMALAQASAGQHAVPAAPGPDKKATTVEGVVVQPKTTAVLPKSACQPTDTACIALVVSTLKTQYPEAFRKLSYWCMNKMASQMAMTVEASDLGYDPGTNFSAGAAQQASCDAVWREARKK